jgi:hypothetical protein
VAGRRTVPVETGASYLSESSGQELMTVNTFIERFIVPLGKRYIHVRANRGDGKSDVSIGVRNVSTLYCVANMFTACHGK